MKNVLFFSPDFDLCLSLLIYLKEKFKVTTTTEIDILEGLAKDFKFDFLILDSEPSKEILKLVTAIKSANSNIKIVETYVFRQQFKEIENELNGKVDFFLYKPFEINEMAQKLAVIIS